MNLAPIETIVGCMATVDGDNEIQRVQTEHRMKLVDFWAIKEGARVLEIGCGQGDTTAALAYTVGEKGFVHGIDIAPADYGAPITLGEARNHLLKSQIGSQVKIDFNVDVLAEEVDFPPMSFDHIVFSHCAFYLRSADELSDILTKARKWGKRLCFAEWDTRIQRIEQQPHLLAVLIQSHYECFKESSLANVRTLFTPADILQITRKSGWTVTVDRVIHSPELQDGRWEVEMTLAEYEGEIDRLKQISDKVKSLLHSEVELLKAANEKEAVEPLSVFAFVAE
ncbi:class I SAM-dependent methyltransferase [Sporosarcina oncorhynchi]|uniref:Class I SAM-dependent methyltransferase n=1 Tax=Sporosarcina oncorhynchi TaxID=3056444 RepID=A0ABZ0L6D0_9BACL|nr:class I SAM-dependent methyltransferase [Sporosarcina sp. T2O-4]WOV87493.1 class I SAM-dependent methyltransferase [Sporosarcina sp. T2O-4]